MSPELELEATQLAHIATQATAAVAGERAIVLVVYADKRASIGASGYDGGAMAADLCWDLLQALQAGMPNDAKITITNSKGESWTVDNNPKVLAKHIFNTQKEIAK